MRTLQRRRSELLAAGATHGPSGWSIPETALDALREGATPVTPVTPDTSPHVAPTPGTHADKQTHRDDAPSAPTDREALADARARVEMLERERGDLIRRAEAAEMTGSSELSVGAWG